jgi:Na+/H+-translocating membrane pyrophosphatase
MDVPPSQLDDPDYARFAWDRYRKLMRWMVLASLLAVVIGLGGLRLMIGSLPIPMMIAAAGGIFLSVLLCAALMGLVFLSSGSGHDEAIVNPLEDADP